ncbi:hypothetical protein [Dongia sp.]|uniref:hypothetical protein n=1 Tax=Dongia sp. TaxID=1977262 RepID=UPI0035B2B275
MSASQKDHRIDATIDLLRRLRAHLQEDMAMISDGVLKGADDRNRQKLAAANFMREELTSLLEYLSARALAHDLPPLDTLKETLEELAGTAARHQRCIESAIAATQERIETVIEARRSAYTSHETYGPNADLRKGYLHRCAMNVRTTNA